MNGTCTAITQTIQHICPLSLQYDSMKEGVAGSCEITILTEYNDKKRS